MNSFLSLVVVAAASVAAVGQASPPTHYMYFDQPRALTPHASMLAVQSDADFAAVDGEMGRAALVDGWVVVTLAQVVTRQTPNLAPADADRFVAPVFVGDNGGPVIPTRDILMQVANENDEIIGARLAAALARFGIAGLMDASLGGPDDEMHRVRTTAMDGWTVLDAANALAREPWVVCAEPEMLFTGRGGTVPNDPLFGQLWGLENTGQSGGVPGIDMSALEAWDITRGDPNIISVVIDVGVDPNHPDINQLPGIDLFNVGNPGGPDNICDRHGTPVAGCIAAKIDNGIGVVGIAPETRIVSVRAFEATASCTGSWTTYTSSTVDALAHAESIGARITNNSNGYGFSSSLIASKYAATRAAGMVHFASAGNDGVSSVTYPASLSTVSAIGALTRQGDLAGFSNRGPALFATAPGQAIVSTDIQGGGGYTSGDTATVNGTSFATPYTAGVAALLLSLDRSLTPDQVERVLSQTVTDLGDPGFDNTFGYGMVNAAGAVRIVNCRADLDQNGRVDSTDLSILLERFGTFGGVTHADGDIELDDDVDSGDLAQLLLVFGGECP